MTLNITVLTPDVIYQSADFRLTNADTHALITDASRKLVSLQYSGWDGLVTYTGVGRWQGRDLSQSIADWVSGVEDATPDWMANRIAERGDQLLDDVHARTGNRYRQTFVLAAFLDGRVHAYLISNFEDGRRRPRAASDRRLRVTPLVLSTHRRSRVLVTGASTAVMRLQRRQLQRIAAAHPGDGGRVRRAVEKINAIASLTPQAAGVISPECVVVSFRSDGAGFIDLSGGSGSRLQQINNGVDVNKFMTDALKTVGIDLEKMQLVGGAYGASNRPRASASVLACTPEVVAPDASERYQIVEIRSTDCEPRSAQGISNSGLVVGTGGQTGDANFTPWMWNAGETLRLASSGSALAVNSEGMAVGSVAGVAALFRDGTVQIFKQTNDVLDNFEIVGSVAHAVNDIGVVAATLQGPVVVPGHANTRTAIYTTTGTLTMLDVPSWTETHPMAVNATGTVLVVVMVAPFNVRSVLWQADDGSWSYVAGNDTANVFPIALSDDGTVLGQIQQGADKVAVICRPGGRWELLGTNPGWAPSGMNNRGDVIGHVTTDVVRRPWLRTQSGEIAMLPCYREHTCMATRINDAGHAVGSAGADHGSHALLWVPRDETSA
jgi:hypothetical protein